MSLVSVIPCNIRNYGSFGKPGILQNFMGWKRGENLHKKSDRPDFIMVLNKKIFFSIFLLFLLVCTGGIYLFILNESFDHIILKSKDINVILLTPEVVNANIYTEDEIVFIDKPYVIGLSKEMFFWSLRRFLLFQLSFFMILFLGVTCFVIMRKDKTD
jgi:hypothetical protein